MDLHRWGIKRENNFIKEKKFVSKCKGKKIFYIRCLQKCHSKKKIRIEKVKNNFQKNCDVSCWVIFLLMKHYSQKKEKRKKKDVLPEFKGSTEL